MYYVKSEKMKEREKEILSLTITNCKLFQCTQARIFNLILCLYFFLLFFVIFINYFNCMLKYRSERGRRRKERSHLVSSFSLVTVICLYL